MQAVSGAGYNGVPSMAIVDNLVPFIGSEEEKMERNMLYLNIRMIKKYSNIIPNYDITIKQFDLINDL